MFILEVVGVLALVFYRLLRKNKSSGFYFIEYILILVLILLAYSPYNSYVTAEENIKIFKNNKEILKCHSGGGIYNSPNYYIVTSDDGWELTQHYFKKGSLIIRADKCEKLK